MAKIAQWLPLESNPDAMNKVNNYFVIFKNFFIYSVLGATAESRTRDCHCLLKPALPNWGGMKGKP